MKILSIEAKETICRIEGTFSTTAAYNGFVEAAFTPESFGDWKTLVVPLVEDTSDGEIHAVMFLARRDRP